MANKKIKIGTKLVIEGEHYIIAGLKSKKVALINLNTGMTWGGVFKVQNIWDIKENELRSVIQGGLDFRINWTL